MQCPYFKKVSFHRIEQREDVEDEIQKQIPVFKNIHCQSKQFEQFEDSIPEEGCTNNIKIQNYNKVSKYDNELSKLSEEVEQQLQKIITIKMPKALEIKQFNIEQKQSKKPTFNLNTQTPSHNEQIQLSQIKDQFSIMETIQTQHKLAQIFPTHPNIFFFNSFYSLVYLPKSSQYCYCQLDEYILKIVVLPDEQNRNNSKNHSVSPLKVKEQVSYNYKYPNIKIKYFIELKKYKTDIKEIKQNILQVIVKSKDKKQQFLIEFLNQTERCTFQCVYISIIDQINSGIKLNKSKKNTKNASNLGLQNGQQHSRYEDSEFSLSDNERSIDSLMFSVERITFQYAKHFLNTFDIILFKGKNIMSKVQRFFTNSDFDHVGLIMKTVGSSLLLLQATGNIGVAIYSFSSLQMVLKNKLYDRVAIRKFCQTKQANYIQKTKRLTALQQFVKKVNGKKYKFDPLYLINWKTSKKKQNCEKNIQEQTFFCSSLVAEALQKCQILKKSKPSYRYLPKHFSDSPSLNLQLNQGYHFSDPIILQK